MYTFITGVILLVLGYILYGQFLSRVLKIDANRLVPAYEKQDGVDYVPMATQKAF